MARDRVFSGLIEGFYGQVWTRREREGVLRGIAAAGYDFHVYAPKGNRSLRREWQRPFTPSERADLAALVRTGTALGLDIGVGLSPFEAWRDWGPETGRALSAKLRELDACGVSLFCLLFDDMSGEMPGLAAMQAEIATFVSDHTAAERIVLCPTYYSDDPVLEKVFGPMPERYLEELGAGLPPAVDVFWTGPSVCSEGFPAAHLDDVADRLGRKPFLWDNYPVNDGAKISRFLRLSPATDRGGALSGGRVAGYAANPMVQPHLSTIPLQALAFLREGGADAEDAALERALHACVPDELGALLLRDCLAFEKDGLDALDAEARRRLEGDYGRFADVPHAREVVHWLREGYAFDPACLTD